MTMHTTIECTVNAYGDDSSEDYEVPDVDSCISILDEMLGLEGVVDDWRIHSVSSHHAWKWSFEVPSLYLVGTATLAIYPFTTILHKTHQPHHTLACGETLRLLNPPCAPFLPAGLCPRAAAAAPAGGLTNANPL
jgi:hypothetical protein